MKFVDNVLSSKFSINVNENHISSQYQPSAPNASITTKSPPIK